MLLFFILPFTYFLRTLIHHSVLHTYQKTPYSLSVLRSYIPFVILICLLITGVIIDPTNIGINYLYRISGFGLFFYVPLLYIFTIFVAYKQKDKLNLRANIAFWLVIVILILLIFFTNDTLTGYHLIAFALLALLPLIAWWVYKDRKKLKNID
jgi:O-antigen/teichoic acid export membrane protein